MGNRAIVQFTRGDRQTQAFYLQWNGGPESIYTFLSVLENDYRCRGDAVPVRFAQLVGNYFGGCLSIYPSENGSQLHEDNGVYRVDTQKTPWDVTHAVPRSGSAPFQDDLRQLTPEELAAEREAAAQHEYNIDGGLQWEIREKNDASFLKG